MLIGDFARLGQVSVRMLRHYDQIGLLKPDSVDVWSSYRSYSPEQLSVLNRLVALKDLGLSLEQVRRVLADRVGLAELRGMLRGERPDVQVATGCCLAVPGTLDDVRRADTVIVPGFVDQSRVFSDEVLDALRYVHRRGRRVVSICTGAFALAAAGLLDGLTATTHWRDVVELAERYPKVNVERDALYVDNGTVLTSAGVACGIDLCLYLVRRDLGATAANRLARLIVAAPHRDGGQSQFIEAPVGNVSGSLAPTRAWALERLGESLTVRDLACHAGFSERTLARRFVDETGQSPLQWLLGARVQLARELVETSEFTVDQVAKRCGLGTAANLRLHFQRQVGTTPTAYRRNFTGG